LYASNSLMRPRQFALKIFDVQLKDSRHFLSMLTESYSVSLRELMKLKGVCFYFDLLRFMVQAAALVKELDNRAILLMHLGRTSWSTTGTATSSWPTSTSAQTL